MQRVYEHQNDLVDGFTKKYQIHDLVYFEQHHDVKEAILREKQLKKWKRYWKIKLINQQNPTWIYLYDSII